MTAATLRQALALASRGWPVLPCLPGQKIPPTPHGYRDATTDERQITVWFASHPDRNLAIATGTPGPDVLDIDNHGAAGNGYAAFRRLKDAGLLDGAAAYMRTPSGGLHAYFTGSAQRNGHLPGQHLDFRSAGGYVLTPPSQVGGHLYQLISRPGGQAALASVEAATATGVVIDTTRVASSTIPAYTPPRRAALRPAAAHLR
jgi:hypothetical protein